MNISLMILKMKIQMNDIRRKFIKNKVIEILRSYNDVSLPIPIKSITKSISNCRLISYTRLMKDQQLSYADVVSFLGSEDACTDYYASKNLFIVYYNDYLQSQISSNRYRWNIAHELGHIVLSHHKENEKTRIFRNSLNKNEYNQLEDEADTFAAYILVPHAILLNFGVKTQNDLMFECKISGQAAGRRYAEYMIWEKRSRKNLDSYDMEIKKIFYQAKSNQKYIFCPTCGYPTGYIGIHNCPICGNSVARLLKEAPKMLYSSVDTDKDMKVKECPRCKNTYFETDGNFCPICGLYLINHCITTDATNSNEFYSDPFCEKGKRLPSNYRFCPYCGNKSYFGELKVLKEWNSSEILNIDEEQLPF